MASKRAAAKTMIPIELWLSLLFNTRRRSIMNARRAAWRDGPPQCETTVRGDLIFLDPINSPRGRVRSNGLARLRVDDSVRLIHQFELFSPGRLCGH